MRKFAIAGVVTLLLASMAQAADMPQMPPASKEHKWLKRFVGQWEGKVKLYMDPTKPPTTAKCTETVKSLGDFWVISETKGSMMGQPFTGVMTVGYDPAKKQYSATWVDSSNSQLWNYTGTVDAGGNKLTLLATGPCPMMPGKTFNFKEVTEFKSDKHRLVTSSMQGPDGKWVTSLSIESWKK
jgi:hypothetical protein